MASSFRYCSHGVIDFTDIDPKARCTRCLIDVDHDFAHVVNFEMKRAELQKKYSSRAIP